jgi:hypothetical protein
MADIKKLQSEPRKVMMVKDILSGNERAGSTNRIRA